MASNDDSILGPLLIGAGLGLIASAMLRNAERRGAFVAGVRSAVEPFGHQLVSANFGRGAGNVPVWTITVHTPVEVRTVRVTLPVGTEPYADSTRAVVVDRVLRAAA